MSKKGILKAQSLLEKIQETGNDLLWIGTNNNDRQDILLAQMFEDGMEVMEKKFNELTLMIP